ncbi:MAG: hypothetical protein JSW50_04430 [Candidatus Latescibacterota bacterium]|nr:MAG: hypothetical protein JSW50_04430 [Candidatus Latescibacterota bacterium]
MRIGPTTLARLVAMSFAAGCIAVGAGPVAAEAPRTPAIHPGAIEVGVAGSFKRQSGVQKGTLWARGGMFAKAPGGLGGAEVGFGYTHESALDVFEVEGTVNWGRRLKATGHYPYVSVGGGWRFDNVGSFSQSRYPVGFGVGIRSLVGLKAGFRLEYRYRRVLGDPVEDFSEHEIVVGVSVFFRNTNNY